MLNNETKSDAVKLAADRYLKVLSRRYNSWCNWSAKFEAYWEAHLASRPLDKDGNPDFRSTKPSPLPYPKGRPSKNSKYAAYEACHFFRDYYNVHVDREDIGTVREWRAVLLAMGKKNVKPLPKCNQKKAA